MIIPRIAEKFNDLFRFRDVARREIKKLRADIAALSARLDRAIQQSDSPLDSMLLNVGPPVFMIMTGADDADGDGYITARRMVWDPTEFGRKGWIKDADDDNSPYCVLPVPGVAGFFHGCRFLAVHSHVANLTEDRSVYVPVAGECFGFAAKITGSPTTGDDGEKYYPWEQLWLNAADRYDSTMTVEGAPLGRALLLSSLTRDERLQTYRHEVPADTPVWIRYMPSVGGSVGGLVFEIGTDPVTTEDCEETP